MISLYPFLLLLLNLNPVSTTRPCSLQTKKVPVVENDPRDITADQITVSVSPTPALGFSNTAVFEDGSVFTIRCAQTGYTFTNGLREVIGVNINRINSKGEVEVVCKDQYFYPDVWVETESGVITKTSYREIWCVPGCAPISDTTLVVNYNLASLSYEEYSPPIFPAGQFVSTAGCRPGYTTSETPAGSLTVSCTSEGGAARWDPPVDQLLKCYKGCPDVRDAVQFGVSSSSPNTGDMASYTVGMQIEFGCEEGFTLVGWSKLKCNANAGWSEAMPECVFLKGAGARPGVGVGVVLVCLLMV